MCCFLCLSRFKEKTRRFFGLFFFSRFFFFFLFFCSGLLSFVSSSLSNLLTVTGQNIIMREPLTKTKTKTKKKEASRATLEKDDAQTDFSVKERIETAMMEVLGKRGLEKTC